MSSPPPARPRGRQSLLAQDHDRACRRCGYGIAAGRFPPRCPMCGEQAWRVVAQRSAG